MPNNAGSLSVVEVSAPEGSILNARFPAAVTARHIIGQLLPDAVFGALRQARPDQVPAEGASSLWNLHLVGGEPLAGASAAEQAALLAGPRFNATSFSTGGTGARPGDGCRHLLSERRAQRFPEIPEAPTPGLRAQGTARTPAARARCAAAWGRPSSCAMPIRRLR